ncbi:asparagine synthase (glutamine-hydrolyzing) [Nitrospira sp. Kam-Ns4a]
MSGFVAIWNLDGRPVDPSLLRRMMDTIAYRGPDGSGQWIRGSVALGHCMLWTTPESLEERQPLTDDTGALCLALDGRVDNRDELKAALRSKGIGLRTDTDAELMLRAYEAWGEECPAHLLGDFAFVIWDGWNRQLVGARDPMGVKPFYYYYDDRLVLCASEIPPLLAHPAVKREINEGMLGEYLACEITSQEETLYANIRRLPPAHVLLVRPKGLWKKRYWSVDPERTLRYRTDQEYADHFRAVLHEAVRCRLRSYGPVGAYLSGGLDSSSVVGVAQTLYRDGLAADQGFETFSLVFPGLPCDERPFIEEVERLWGLTSNRARPEAWEPTAWANCARQSQDFPGYPNGTMANPLRALAQEKGIRVLLTGGGGDEWLAGSFYHAADLLRQWRILPLLRRISRASGSSAPRELAHAFLGYAVQPLLPTRLHRMLRKVFTRDGVPHWIVRGFARRIHLADRLAVPSEAPRFPSFAQAEIYATLTSGWWPHSCEVEERAASRFGLEERHPLTDLRLAEFALALPEDQRWRGAVPKFILRQAVQGLLPESVRQRVTKVEFSAVFSEAFTALGGPRFFESLLTVARGWVEERSAQAMYREQEQTGACVWPLWMIAGTELWLQAVEAGKANLTRTPRRKQERILVPAPP